MTIKHYPGNMETLNEWMLNQYKTLHSYYLGCVNN